MSHLIGRGRYRGETYPLSSRSTGSAQARRNWFLDGVGGNDGNSGATAGDPIQTIMGGIVPKWGTVAPYLPNGFDLTVLRGQPVGLEAASIAPYLGPLATLLIAGVPVNVGAPFTSAGGTTYLVRGNPGTLTTVAGASGSVARGLVLNNLSRGSTAFVDSSSGTALCATPFTTAATAAIDTGWASGQTFQAQQLPALNLVSLNVQGGGNNGTEGLQNVVSGIDFVDPSGTPGQNIFVSQSTANFALRYRDCRFDTFPTFVGLGGFAQYLVNCFAPYGGTAQGGNNVGVFNESAVELYGGIYAGSEFSWGLYNVGIYADALFEGTEAFEMWGRNGVYALALNAPLLVDNGSTLLVPAQPGVWTPGASASVNVTSGAEFQNAANDWVARMQVSDLLLDGVATGSSYAAGAFVDNIALSPTNLAAHQGLQNVRTGSRFAST